DYQGEFLFVNGKLDKVFTEEGYYQPTAATKTKKSDFGTYYYTLKDHLGHTRVVVDEEENVIQETAYYPYGGIIADLSTKTKYNYLYTGKEFIDSLGVNWYDHHARYYDPEVGRWFAIDPALQAASPYMVMGNNPMMMIDEDGEIAFLAAVGIGALIGAGSYTASVAFSDGGFDNWNWGQFAFNTLKGAAMSAMTAGITTGIGDAFSGVSNGFLKVAGSAAAHGVAQGGLSYVQGGSFGEGFASGALGSLGASVGNLGLGRVGYGITGAAGGSLGALLTGGDVLKGGITGGIVGLWNHGQHDNEPVAHVNLPEVSVVGNRAISLIMAGLGGRFGDDYLGFTGTRSPRRTRVDGTLTWYRNTAVGPEIVKTWTARSGSRSLLPTPQGEWKISNWRTRTKHGFVKDGVGFSVDITPDPMHGRQYLRIHPDGGLPGTAGCIGLTGNAQELRLFSSMIRNHLSQYGSMRLNVGYTIPSIQLYP
ncbi:MAG: hypothetical protein N4A74_13740, partial [Carboxylicivirga sp.]|nr:hypothetical protein [Carboxylicivirga sp.]